MGMRRIFAVVLLVTATCMGFAQMSPFQITWSTYKSGEYSSIKTFQTFTLRNQSDFASYWAQSTGNTANTAPNDIDWLKNEALAIHLGERNSAGYSVYVQSIDMVTGANYNVHAVEQVPSGGATAQVVTSPFTIILLPKRYAQYNVSIVKESIYGGPPEHGGGDHDRDDWRNGYRMIERGYLSDGPRQMAMNVLRSKREWNRFWDDATDGASLTVIGRSRSKSIDWDDDQVLILQAGPSMSQQPLEIRRVKRTETGFTVFVTKRGDDYVVDRPFYPYIAIEVPGHTGKFDITVVPIGG